MDQDLSIKSYSSLEDDNGDYSRSIRCQLGPALNQYYGHVSLGYQRS